MCPSGCRAKLGHSVFGLAVMAMKWLLLSIFKVRTISAMLGDGNGVMTGRGRFPWVRVRTRTLRPDIIHLVVAAHV